MGTLPGLEGAPVDHHTSVSWADGPPVARSTPLGDLGIVPPKAGTMPMGRRPSTGRGRAGQIHRSFTAGRKVTLDRARCDGPTEIRTADRSTGAPAHHRKAAMARQSPSHQPSPHAAAHARDRAMTRVRRATAGIGLAATAGAVGLGVLVATSTTAHSSATTQTTSVSGSTSTTPTTATTPTTVSGQSSTTTAAASSAASSSTATTATPSTTTTTTAPKSSSSSAATVSGQS